MNPPTIYYLLFLLASSGDEGPLGVYRDRERCHEEGKEISAVVNRHYECRPATETVIRYFASECLGDTKSNLNCGKWVRGY